MAAVDPSCRDRFAIDLLSSLEAAGRDTVKKTSDARERHWEGWCEFCAEHNKQPHLSDVAGQESKLCYLLVYGLRYRTVGRTGKPVKAGSVADALLAVGTGITHLGFPDFRKTVGGGDTNHPLLASFLKALRDEDDPSKRAYPVNITIIRALYETLDTNHPLEGQANRTAIDLIIVGFYWLLRPAEYLKTESDNSRSQAFRLMDIMFRVRRHNQRPTHLPANNPSLNDLNPNAYVYASLTFDDQKNGVRGEAVGHNSTDDELLCPARALARIAAHLRAHDAPIDTPISTYWDGNGNQWHASSKLLTNALRHAASSLEEDTGIPADLISARGLRPGGATALLCAGVDKDMIQLLGRWKSDAMLRYLRIQAATHRASFSQRMLDHGDYTFAPQDPTYPGEVPIPNQAPGTFVQALANPGMVVVTP